MLERVLRKFACLTKGDTISINYNNHDYEMCVLECLPADVSCEGGAGAGLGVLGGGFGGIRVRIKGY